MFHLKVIDTTQNVALPTLWGSQTDHEGYDVPCVHCKGPMTNVIKCIASKAYFIPPGCALKKT